MSDPQTPARKLRAEREIVFIIMTVVLAFDQGTKWIVEATMRLGERIIPFPAIGDFFRITHVANTGAAFGTFQNGSWFFTIVALVVSLFIIYYNYQLPRFHWGMRIALGFQLGGALGNLFDRLRIGHVTDFIDLNFLPFVANFPALQYPFLDFAIFNIADMSIVGGVLALAVMIFLEGDPEIKREATEVAATAVPSGAQADIDPVPTAVPPMAQTDVDPPPLPQPQPSTGLQLPEGEPPRA